MKKLMLLFRKEKTQAIEAADKQATKVHRQNISKIVQSRQSADKVERVLRQNGITIQIAKAMGHR